MNDSFLSCLGEFLLFAGGVILVMFMVWCLWGSPIYHYDYTDIDGTTGTADNCWVRNGAAFCTCDNTTIQVKSYTRIKEN